MSMFSWKVVYEGKTPPPGAAVAPDERLSWGRTAGLGAQHVVAMFGATFVFPIIMGLNPQLAIMMSGVATIIFLLIVQGKVPSYLGTSASFVGGATAIYAQDGGPADVTGAILIAGAVLALVGLLIHFAGTRMLHAVLPPVVTGAVVMLIGFNLAPVVADIYWPQDQWVALLTMFFVILVAVIGLSVAVAFEMVLRNLVAVGPAIWVLNVLGMAAGLAIGRAIGVGRRDSMTLAIEIGVQNVTLAIFLTLTVLGSLELAVTQNVYGVVMLLNGTILIRLLRRRIAAEA